jgi:hypothetical protein
MTVKHATLHPVIHALSAIDAAIFVMSCHECHDRT